MVQYQVEPFHSATPDKNYWRLFPASRLSRTEIELALSRGGIAFNKTSSKKRLEVLYTRVARGLLIYDKCTAKELRSFCLNRGLATPSTVPKKVSSLRDLLEDADDRATKFEKFHDLPAELRVRVYELHFKSFNLTCVAPVAPICQVNRLIRKEALPVMCAHPIILHVRPGFHKQFTKKKLQPAMYFRSIADPHKVFDMPQHLFQHIRQITIAPRFWFTMPPKMSWTIFLDAKTSGTRIVSSLIDFKGPAFLGTERSTYGIKSAAQSDQLAEIDTFERGLKEFAEDIFEASGEKTFDIVDFENILHLLDRAWDAGRLSQL